MKVVRLDFSFFDVFFIIQLKNKKTYYAIHTTETIKEGWNIRIVCLYCLSRIIDRAEKVKQLPRHRSVNERQNLSKTKQTDR